jgi:hypothetical protein
MKSQEEKIKRANELGAAIIMYPKIIFKERGNEFESIYDLDEGLEILEAQNSTNRLLSNYDPFDPRILNNESNKCKTNYSFDK